VHKSLENLNCFVLIFILNFDLAKGRKGIHHFYPPLLVATLTASGMKSIRTAISIKSANKTTVKYLHCEKSCFVLFEEFKLADFEFLIQCSSLPTKIFFCVLIFYVPEF